MCRASCFPYPFNSYNFPEPLFLEKCGLGGDIFGVRALHRADRKCVPRMSVLLKVLHWPGSLQKPWQRGGLHRAFPLERCNSITTSSCQASSSIQEGGWLELSTVTFSGRPICRGCVEDARSRLDNLWPRGCRITLASALASVQPSPEPRWSHFQAACATAPPKAPCRIRCSTAREKRPRLII